MKLLEQYYHKDSFKLAIQYYHKNSFKLAISHSLYCIDCWTCSSICNFRIILQCDKALYQGLCFREYFESELISCPKKSRSTCIKIWFSSSMFRNFHINNFSLFFHISHILFLFFSPTLLGLVFDKVL